MKGWKADDIRVYRKPQLIGMVNLICIVAIPNVPVVGDLVAMHKQDLMLVLYSIRSSHHLLPSSSSSLLLVFDESPKQTPDPCLRLVLYGETLIDIRYKLFSNKYIKTQDHQTRTLFSPINKGWEIIEEPHASGVISIMEWFNHIKSQ